MSDPSMAQRKKSLGGCATALLGLVLLIVLGVTLFWVWSIRWERQFARKLKELSDQGEPVSKTDLDAFYCLPEDTVNTTELWEAATLDFDSAAFNVEMEPYPFVGTGEDIPVVGEAWGQLDAVTQLLDRYRDRIDLMHSAAKQGGAARYSIENESPNDFLPRLRNASRLLHLESRVQAHHENPAEVFRTLETMLRCGESFEHAPLFFSQMVRSYLDSAAAIATSEALYDVEFDDEQLGALQSMFRSVDSTEGYQRAAKGERCVILNHFRDYVLSDDALDSGWAEYLKMRVVRQDMRTYFKETEIAATACQKPCIEAVPELDAQQLRIQQLNGIRHELTKVSTPTYRSIALAKAEGESWMRMIDLAIAIERYRRANGKLPEAIAACAPDFIPAVPKDPYDGKDIRYVVPDVDGRVFLLFSVGRDLTDHGGVEDDGMGGGDNVLRVGARDSEDGVGSVDQNGGE